MMSTAKRKICVVTGTRAEYGLLFWLMKEIAADDTIELQIIATCAHLSPEQGSTVRFIEEDGFKVSERIEILLSSDSSVGTAKSTGLAVIGFADAFSRLRPDLVVVLGDRFEILGVATAALLMTIPLVHLCGGELTEGAFDDSIRHAITKCASIHFTTHETYRHRVLQLGEMPSRVFDVGSISAENVHRTQRLDRETLFRELNLPLDRQILLTTYHPETLAAEAATDALDELFAALNDHPDAHVVFTLPNADPQSHAVRHAILERTASSGSRFHAFSSLGQLRYLSLMSYSAVIVGNSSSGILEAPVFGLPTVNIGHRQKGRLRQPTIIDCESDRASISKALGEALSGKFAELGRQVSAAYRSHRPSSVMHRILAEVELLPLRRKAFVDQAYVRSQ